MAKVDRIIRLSIALLLVGGCDMPSNIERNEQETSHSLRAIPEIRYFRDHRVGLCFGYFYQKENFGQYATGGPALATVPCEAVKGLLINGGADAH